MGQIVTDNFNRANAGTLGSKWVQIDTSLACWNGISSNQAQNAQSTHDGWTAFTDASWTPGSTGDQYAECQVTAISAGNGGGGPAVRCVVGNATGYSIYYVELISIGSSATHNIAKYVSGGAFTSIATWTGTVQSTDVVRIEAQGTTIRAKVNGTQVASVTDNSIAAGFPGLVLEQSGHVGDTTADNWAAGDFSSPIDWLLPDRGRLPTHYVPTILPVNGRAQVGWRRAASRLYLRAA
jgi:hypothetical protein